MELTITIVLFLYAFLFDFLPVFKKKKKNATWVYLFLLISSFCILMIYHFYPHTKSIAGVIMDIDKLFINK